MIRAADIHARLGAAGWANVLASLGIGDQFLRKRAGPCPSCGGSDRFTFDNRKGRGDFFCRQCGPGDGFQLLTRIHGWTFSQARAAVLRAAGMSQGGGEALAGTAALTPPEEPPRAEMPTRVRLMRRQSCEIADCPDAVAYLESRKLWPLPPGCLLRAHAGAEYFRDRQRAGRFAALVADIADCEGDVISAHVTYLEHGKKLTAHEPRKILSPLTGRTGCAVRLMPLSGPALGIAEGIETALSASRIHGLPVWAALNTSLLAKFSPPPEVSELVIFADRDAPGLSAAAALAESLQQRCTFRMRLPTAPAKDWNDVLQGKTDDER